MKQKPLAAQRMLQSVRTSVAQWLSARSPTAHVQRLADMLQDMRGRSLTVWLDINNHYEGSAPLTRERLRERGVTPDLAADSTT